MTLRLFDESIQRASKGGGMLRPRKLKAPSLQLAQHHCSFLTPL